MLPKIFRKADGPRANGHAPGNFGASLLVCRQSFWDRRWIKMREVSGSSYDAGLPTVQQAAIGDCAQFDPFPFRYKWSRHAQSDVSRRRVGDALVVGNCRRRRRPRSGLRDHPAGDDSADTVLEHHAKHSVFYVSFWLTDSNYSIAGLKRWQQISWGSIIYWLLGGNFTILYEAAEVDGAGRWSQL